jgi:hypothetical protein
LVCAGDCLVFHPDCLHWGLPNASDQIRLSVDVRGQPLSAPRTYQTDTTLAELRGLRADVQELLAAEGVVGAEFEELVIEVMGFPRSWEPTEESIRALLRREHKASL